MERAHTILLPEAASQGLFNLKLESEQDTARKAVRAGGGLAILSTTPLQVISTLSDADAKRILTDLVANDAKLPKAQAFPPAAPPAASLLRPPAKRKGQLFHVTPDEMKEYFGIEHHDTNAAMLRDYRKAAMFEQFAKESKLETFASSRPLDDAPRTMACPQLTKLYLNAFRKKPVAGEFTCTRDQQCHMLTGDAHRGYVGKRFELPAGSAPLPKNVSGYCIVCLIAQITLEAQINLSGDFTPTEQINPFTVHVGAGGYDKHQMLDERNEFHISGIVGHFPAYSENKQTYDVPISDEKAEELQLDPDEKHYLCAEIGMDFPIASAEPTFGVD